MRHRIAKPDLKALADLGPVAVLGAAGTGKTWLVQTLAAHWQAMAHDQVPRIQAATRGEGLCLVDSPPLQLAVAADLLGGDCSLYDKALAHHASFQHTLLMGTDLLKGQGLSDALHHRFDARLRQALGTAGLAFSVVYGQGARRADNAVSALRFLDGKQDFLQYLRGVSATFLRANDATERTETPPAAAPELRWHSHCERCSDPACEYRLFTRHQPA